MKRLHVGLVVNPLAGIGGSLALKGSDGEALREIAAGPDAPLRAAERTARTLAVIVAQADLFRFSCWGGEMGENELIGAGLNAACLGSPATEPSSPADTRAAVTCLLEAGIDLLLFAGGDGTARDVHDVLGQACPALGIPTGVKMHSGVFALSPEAAGALLLRLACGGLVGIRAQEVRDIDEEAFRRDEVRSRFYGDLLVPGEGAYLQRTKVGGRENVDLVVAEIAAWQAEHMEDGRLYLMGPGSTTAAIMEELGLPNTLLGVDAVRDGALVASDLDARRMLSLLEQGEATASIVVTAIGGQGYLFGRGNQQFVPEIIRAVGADNIIVVAAKSKISGFEGRPLLVDTNDPGLDEELSGYRTVNTGYDDHILYRVSPA